MISNKICILFYYDTLEASEIMEDADWAIRGEAAHELWKYLKLRDYQNPMNSPYMFEILEMLSSVYAGE